MGLISKLIIGIVLVFSFVYFTTALSITEFKDLTDEELQDWNYESIGTTYTGIDTVYHFEMDVYRYYEPTNIMRLEREPFSFSCSEEDCNTFFNNELLILQTIIFNEYKELQDEL
tara:strand:+ start:729 stop:1073 length:345 start_codon:yes stop_codon:yes gene_type:complete